MRTPVGVRSVSTRHLSIYIKWAHAMRRLKGSEREQALGTAAASGDTRVIVLTERHDSCTGSIDVQFSKPVQRLARSGSPVRAHLLSLPQVPVGLHNLYRHAASSSCAGPLCLRWMQLSAISRAATCTCAMA